MVERAGPGVTVSKAEKLPAETVTVVEAFTEFVEIGKFAIVAPAGTVTLAGTVATAELLLERATVRPPTGAEPLSVTVPVEAVPPTTLVGLRLNEAKVAGRVTVSTAVLLAPP